MPGADLPLCLVLLQAASQSGGRLNSLRGAPASGGRVVLGRLRGSAA